MPSERKGAPAEKPQAEESGPPGSPSDFWNQAFECSRQAEMLRQLAEEGFDSRTVGRKFLNGCADQLDQWAAVLKARAAAAEMSTEQRRFPFKRRLTPGKDRPSR